MTLRNILMLPLVVLIRLPILLPLFALTWIGCRAEELADAIGPYLPGLRREHENLIRKWP